MALVKRIIPCLDIRDGRVVKGVNFVNIRDAGDPAAVAARYDSEGADELVFLDITASVEKRATFLTTVQTVAEQISIPLTVGGGVQSVADAERLLKAGADKVSFNTAAVNNPQLLTDCAAHFGAQCIVLAVDARQKESQKGCWEVVTHGGRTATGRDACEWVAEAAQRGAGEILLTSMDSDGVQNGYDLPLTKAIAAAAPLPLIASGGAGCPEHIAAVLAPGLADAALAASIFHDRIYSVQQVKAYLKHAKIPVRPV